MHTSSPQHQRRLQFATTVLAYADHHGVTLTRAFEWGAATFTSFDGCIPSYGAFKTFVFRNRDRLKPSDALSSEIRAIFDELATRSRSPLERNGEGVGGGGVPSAVEGADEAITATTLRKLDRDERDRFIRETIASLTAAYERDHRMVYGMIRHYATLMATAR